MLDEALDLPSHERQTWLESLDRSQPALTPTLRQLLAVHARHESGDFMERGPALVPAAHKRPTPGEPIEQLQAGDAIGPYRLLRPLGSGGMAVVWLAERSDGHPPTH